MRTRRQEKDRIEGNLGNPKEKKWLLKPKIEEKSMIKIQNSHKPEKKTQMKEYIGNKEKEEMKQQ